jgi:hypothetical protein
VEILETPQSTLGLVRYLNPDDLAVDAEEAGAAAKLIHWMRRSRDAQDALLSFAFEHYAKKVRRLHEEVGLDGRTDVEVLICADIAHHGRGGGRNREHMRNALASQNSVDELLRIGAEAYPERVAQIRRRVFDGIADGRLGRCRYAAATATLVQSLDAPQADRPEPPARSWPEAHLERKSGAADRTDIGGVFKLSEPGAPARTSGAGVQEKVAALRAIALWLNPKASARYQRRDGRTRCNIYAYDFATLGGAYVPRVWWTKAAWGQALAGQSPSAVYAKTVEEQSANALFRWFRDHSDKYGWRRAGNVNELQHHANGGGLAVIVARNKKESSSGHIALVAPEESVDESGTAWTAVRENGVVSRPVQSQAGAVNFSFGRTGAWWNSDKMAEHGFWVHD